MTMESLERERLVRRLEIMRARRIEARIKVLLANGTRLGAITRFDDRSCPLCHGTGIASKLDDDGYYAEECPRCYGVAIVDPKAKNGVLEFRNPASFDPESEQYDGWQGANALVPPREWATIAERIRLT
jgi:hypothetical protein